MTTHSPFRIAIAGLGTVGIGVVKILETHKEVLALKAGRPVEVTAVSARNRNLDRGADLGGYAWEDDATALAARDDVDCVVEVIGGSDGPAKALVEKALTASKHVVTANKALIAHHGHDLSLLAEEKGVALRAEAGVAGGIPILKTLSEGLAANEVTRVFGVLNGTCNYILTEMAKTKAAYQDVLADAQRLGYAEADPTFDVEGIDAAHKLAILAAIAFGTKVDFEGVITEGIGQITLTDIEMAKDMGFAIKHLGLARIHAEGLEQRVRPCMVPANTAIGALPGVTNTVIVEGDFIGQTAHFGPGAGEGPTASAIVADILDAASGVIRPLFGRPAATLNEAPRLSHGEEHSPYYLRFTLDDQPGALASLAARLGEAGISIHRMRQYGMGNPVPVVIVTHDAQRSAIDVALDKITALDVSKAPPVAIRIESV
ncbi:homoserine dehydrogenase [Rhodobacteraceae bacterium NNCM2]|nr:homoserine dehydrogenase [Coraliihabitans acroporae]